MTTAPDDAQNTRPANDVFTQLGWDVSEAWTLGRHLRVSRQAEGWTLAEVAQRVGCSPQRLSDYEHGKRLPSLRTILKLATAFEFAPSFFLQLWVEEQLKKEGVTAEQVGLNLAVKWTA